MTQASLEIQGPQSPRRRKMSNKLTFLALAALASAPAMVPETAVARHYSRHHYVYRGQTRHYQSNCSGGDGAVGTIVGGGGGAVIGHALGGGTLGTIAGGVGGAL